MTQQESLLTPRSEDVNSMLKGIFQEWDTDGNGLISQLELKMVMQAFGTFNSEEIDAVMGEMGATKTGRIQYDEFVDWMTKPQDKTRKRHSIFDGESRQLEALRRALKGLFSVYDRNHDGAVEFEEFRECHCVLQGALHAHPTGNTGTADPSPFLEDAEYAFDAADTDHDQQMTFVEFEAWQRASMDQSGLTSARLTELVLKLTEVLQGVFHMAEEVDEQGNRISRDIPETEQPMLMDMADKLATYSRELFSKQNSDTLSDEDQSPFTNKWCEPSPGISLRRLMQRHMREPIPTMNVKSMDVEVILCVPEHGTDEVEEEDESRRRRWIAKVVRTITYKSQRPPSQPDYYYAYEGLQWNKLSGSAEYDQAVATLAPEFQLYALLLKEADFGTKLNWKKVVAALTNAVQMGVMTQDTHKRYEDYMKMFIIKTLREDGRTASNKIAEDYLNSQVELSPLIVMSGLCEWRLIKENPLWADA